MLLRKARNLSFSSPTTWRSSGTTLAEAPVALWMLFVGIGFPLLILGSLTLRFGLFWQAAKEAAQVSCQAQTFLTPPTYPANATSAVMAATSTATTVINTFSGCQITQPVAVYIGSTPTSSSVTSWSATANTPLDPSAIDTDTTIYSIKVVLVGQVNPLVTLNIPYFGNIPGLTQAFPVTVAEERIFENPSGLTQ